MCFCLFVFSERTTRLHKYQDDSAEVDVEALDVYSMVCYLSNSILTFSSCICVH